MRERDGYRTVRYRLHAENVCDSHISLCLSTRTHLARPPAAGPGRARMSHTVRTESEGTCTPSVLYPSDVRTPLAAYGLRDAHPACAIHTNTRLTHNTEKSESEHFAHDKEQPRLALHIQSSTQLLASRAHGCVSHVSCAAAPSASSSSRESSSFLRCASLALSTAAMPAGCERRIALLPCGGKLRLGRAKRGPRGAFSIIALSVAAMQSGRSRDAGAPRAFRRGPTEPSRATGGAAAAGADRCMH